MDHPLLFPADAIKISKKTHKYRVQPAGGAGGALPETLMKTREFLLS
jgi:hypothetical protein